MGALLDILPRVVDRKDKDGETVKGVYADHITAVIGAGAFDETIHRNDQFLRATGVGPYPIAMQEAWGVMRAEAITNYGIEEDEEDEETLARLGPLADATPTQVKNRGATERRKGRRTGPRAETAGLGRPGARGPRTEEGAAREPDEEDDEQDEMLEAMTRAISQQEKEDTEAREPEGSQYATMQSRGQAATPMI